MTEVRNTYDEPSFHCIQGCEETLHPKVLTSGDQDKNPLESDPFSQQLKADSKSLTADKILLQWP